MDQQSFIKKEEFELPKSGKKSVNVTSVELEGETEKEKKPKEKKPAEHSYAHEIMADLEYRQQFKVTEMVDGEEVDMTPNYISDQPYADQFLTFNVHLKHEVNTMQLLHSRSSRSRTRQSMRGGVGGNKQSMDELINGIIFENIVFSASKVEEVKQGHVPVPFKKSFVKVTLRKSDFFVLFNQPSTTVAKGTPQGEQVEADNRHYEYLTMGKGKVRRRSDNDAQTTQVLTNSRAVNTIYVDFATVGSYVSNFEMYDTLEGVNPKKDAHTTMQSLAKPGESVDTQEMDAAAAAYHEEEEAKAKERAKNQATELYQRPEFKTSLQYIGRTLSSNLYKAGMQRFRNFQQVDRCAPDVEYKYSLKLLFRLIPVPSYDERKAVSDMSFCTTNSDILAISYGLFSFSSQQVPNSGDVYIWSIKNPGEPERAYYYKIPVTALCFSPYLPSLIAIGMYDGSVEVRNVADLGNVPIAVSQRSTSPGCSPVVAIRWLKQTTDDDANEIDPFLSLSQDGSVTRFSITKSPYLLGFTQMTLERIEGHPEGIRVPLMPTTVVESNRHPQGLYITTHPVHKDIYYILTDEGCIHKCSINYQHQYLEVLKCHDGGVNVMEFSPWSPKLFLTCGNDWYVRIWIDGMTRPLIELLDDFQPVHWANWSPTHSTVLVSMNRDTVSVWDIRRNILKPMGKHEMDSSYNTIGQFSNSGTTLVVGNERGNALFQGLNDMPFPPHFQYDELEKSIYKAIGNDQDLFIELKSIGFFGYPGKKNHKP
ncbi:dynein axonemal intermediate chain 4 [Drosophila sulfurigaster albostrigata]|uniref:dynein axonemal intermediate chain 4 n=1 Tax=Drosophila sulfurigaster albostrigata TaxID=89887 RepID=UPI002D21DEA9|nr:dynein axonemal intermediate chain 4 [Drosophila sulfurigaster albostrigata]